MILTSERAQVSRGPVLGPALAAHVVDGVEAVGVGDGPRDVDIAADAGPDGALSESCGCCGAVKEAETVRRGAGRGIPLYPTVTLLLADTGLVILRGQELTRAEPVTLDSALHTGVPLDTVMRGAAMVKLIVRENIARNGLTYVCVVPQAICVTLMFHFLRLVPRVVVEPWVSDM